MNIKDECEIGLTKRLYKSTLAKILLIVTCVISGLLVLALGNPLEWKIWDNSIEPEPLNLPVVISAQLKFDNSGVYTGEIRRSLEKADFRYRIINRVFPTHKAVVTSRERIENTRNQAESILDNHGGDLLIYGEVSAKANIVRIDFIGWSFDEYIETDIEVDIGQESWADEVTQIVEVIAIESAFHQFVGMRGLTASASLEELLDASESKLLELNKGASTDFLKERTDLGIEEVQITRAKIKNDVATIKKIKNRLEKLVGTNPHIAESYHHKTKRLLLADLYMFEGLMDGNPSLIDNGLNIAMESGIAMLEQMGEDQSGVQIPVDATFANWLAMSILVLACDDEDMMAHFELLFKRHCGPKSERLCMPDSDALRILIPLSQLNRHPNRAQLETLRGALSEHRDFGMGMLDHWQDPYLHARRLITRRLASMQNIEKQERGTNCPSLKKWMEMKGWFQTTEQGQLSTSSFVIE